MKPSQTSKDFKKEYKEIQKNTDSLNSHLNIRLKEMVTANPEAPLHGSPKVVFNPTTAGIILGTLSLNEFNFFDIKLKIDYLKAIEEYIENKEKYIQGKLFK